MEDLVSIITPLYNSEKYIEETILSVLQQKYKNWEMLIVNDNSSDSGPEIVKKYLEKDSRIKLINSNINLGGAGARNKAIELSRGKYIAFLDSDDIWEENKLKEQINFMKENKFLFTYTKYERITEDGRRMNLVSKLPLKISYKDMLKNDLIGCLTAVYDAGEIGKVYMPNIRIGQDYALWLEILKKVDYAYGLDKILAKYRVRNKSLSKNKLKKIKYIWGMYRKYNNKNILATIFYICYTSICSVFNLKMMKIKGEE